MKIINFKPLLIVFLLFNSCVIAGAQSGSDDQSIKRQAEQIVAALVGESGESLQVTVAAGVITVEGSTAVDPGLMSDALGKIEGVIAVVIETERILPAVDSLEPAVSRMEQLGLSIVNYLPLIGIALGVILVFWMLARAVCLLEQPLKRSFPVASVRDVIMQGLRVFIMMLGCILALEILDATALVGGVLGAAGVVGIAIGFAFRDLIENYIASIMLGLRQPFRPGDFVRISQNEGIVARLSSRSTILVTLEGNRLRIPNGDVFKSTILNFSTTPERRFEFDVGISYRIDPDEAIQLGIQTLKALKGVAADPGPFGRVVELGDSTIKITFFAWVDQNQHDYGLVRSCALIAINTIFNDHGIEMPEPTYNLRMLSQAPAPATETAISAGTKRRPSVTEDAARDGGTSGMDFARREAAKEASAGDNSLEEKAPELLD